MRWRSVAAGVVFILACLIALGLASDFLVDWLWFSAIGYFGVFWTIFRAKAFLFLEFVVSTVALWANTALASGFARRRQTSPSPRMGGSASGQDLSEGVLALFGPTPSRCRRHVTMACAAILVGTLFAWAETGNWDVALKFIRQVPTARAIPFTARISASISSRSQPWWRSRILR